MAKPLAVREYEADALLWQMDRTFAEEVGVRGPLPPLPPPNVIYPGTRPGQWDAWGSIEPFLIRHGYAP